MFIKLKIIFMSQLSVSTSVIISLNLIAKSSTYCNEVVLHLKPKQGLLN